MRSSNEPLPPLSAREVSVNTNIEVTEMLELPDKDFTVHH